MSSVKDDKLEPGLGTRNFEMILRFSKFRKNFRLQSGGQSEFCCTPYEKRTTVPDTDYITSATRKLMLDTPSLSSFQNIGLLI